MDNISITAIVLAAGKGSRMHSHLPKSLHPVAGRPILARILTALRQANITQIHVVINSEHTHLIQPITQNFKAKLCFQDTNKKGTAAAALSVQIQDKNSYVLIVNGDHPLISSEDLNGLIQKIQKEKADLCVSSYVTQNPENYGRVLRQKDRIMAIIEKDSLTQESAKIKEVNVGIYLIKAQCLLQYLPKIQNHNSQKEYCFTDIVSICVNQGQKVTSFLVSADSAFGVNTQRELAFATKKIFTRKLNSLMNQGVIIIDPLNIYVEESVHVGNGSVIYPGVYLKGNTSIGSFCAIEMNSFIMDCTIHDLVLIRAGSYLELTEVGVHSVIGPYARLRAGTKIEEKCRVGNFVEMKQTHFGSRSKASHFSYLGDATIGEDVNIGCGTVTCNLNLDGKKYPTKIGDKVFIGSGTQIVAPVELKENSATGAGSVITQDVPVKALAVARATQKNIEDHF